MIIAPWYGSLPQRVARCASSRVQWLTADDALRYSAVVQLDARADTLLRELARSADSPDLRERTARALTGENRHVEAVATLCARFAHFNAHEPGALPCLCRLCLRPDESRTTLRGTEFIRDFTVASGRVLFFWVPADLRDQARAIERSVNAELRARLHP